MASSRAALALGVLVLAAPAWAQDWKGMGRLEGRVLDKDRKPIPDAAVKLELPGRGGTTVRTDKDGKWAIGGIAAGNWNIDFEAPGYAKYSASLQLPSESARIPPRDVQLEKAAPAGPPPEVMEAIQKGDAAYKEGRYAEARLEYEKLLGLRPDIATVLHQQIARCYHQEGNHAKELDHLQVLLDGDATNTEIRVLMAMEAIEADMLERALELLQGVDESVIKSPEVYFNVGAKFMNKGKTDTAQVYFGRAIAVNATFVDGYFYRGLTYLGQQKMALAKADFQKVLDLAPEGAQAETAKKALADIEKALAPPPSPTPKPKSKKK